MSTRFIDESGTTRLVGDLVPAPSGGIPQGGPLTQTLLVDNNVIAGNDAAPGGTGGNVAAGNGTGSRGGATSIAGGQSPDFTKFGATINAQGATNAVSGRVQVVTDSVPGAVGQVLVPDGTADNTLVWGGIISAAAVPVAAPAGSLPFAFDSTAVSGGLYFWNGAAWVKVSTIP